MNLHLPAWPLARLPSSAGAWAGLMWSAMFGRREAGGSEPAANDGSAADDDCRRALRGVIEGQIIPRLLLASRPGVAEAGAEAGAAPMRVLPDDVIALAQVCAVGDRAGAARIIGRLEADGLPVDSMLLDLIGPAARHLGQQWEDDRLGFADVTVGLVLMHELIHTMGYGHHEGPLVAGSTRRIMLASAPGSQHVLGLSIVSEFFRTAGWQVVVEVSSSRAALCRAVGDEWFDLLGVSVALDAQLPELPGLVADLRAAARNPATPVLLGGPVFARHELSAEAFGAQAICLDARASVGLAHSMLTA